MKITTELVGQTIELYTGKAVQKTQIHWSETGALAVNANMSDGTILQFLVTSYDLSQCKNRAELCDSLEEVEFTSWPPKEL